MEDREMEGMDADGVSEEYTLPEWEHIPGVYMDCNNDKVVSDALV